MPCYFYHLKFELYRSPKPAEGGATSGDSIDVWLPETQQDSIFDDLPRHRWPQTPKSRVIPRSNSFQSSSRATATPSAWGGNIAGAANSSVIDCGNPRAPVKEDGRNIQIISERQWLERTKSFPPPSSSAAIGPETAQRDWRFGSVRVVTVDPACTGTSTMAGEASKTGPSAAPTLGPSFGGAGTATKADFVPLATKNTELGWGVVHFYREGDETPSLNTVEQEEHDGDDSAAEGCTTLCIPAVPAYMSPGDFLGFMGERWTADISHCRMVMTSKMNRYLVLLKFRDGRRAKAWRREFDGKVFNSMEVSAEILSLAEIYYHADLFAAASLSRCFCQKHHL